MYGDEGHEGSCVAISGTMEAHDSVVLSGYDIASRGRGCLVEKNFRPNLARGIVPRDVFQRTVAFYIEHAF